MGLYLRPTTVDEALAAIRGGALTVLAGGTDFYPARLGRPLDEDILDITAIPALRGIEERDDHWRIGATTTWTDVIRAELPPLFTGLKLAAREVGGVQIQNTATVCGNLCNASPAADGVPVLLSLDATVEIDAGDTLVPLGEFITGNRQTMRRPDQLVTGVLVPKPLGRAAGHFLKLGARKYLVISIVMAAGSLAVDDNGRISTSRVAVGSCAPVACRLPALEAALLGRPLRSQLGDLVEPAHLDHLAPIDDIRASGAYRQEAALVLVRRLLDELGGRL